MRQNVIQGLPWSLKRELSPPPPSRQWALQLPAVVSCQPPPQLWLYKHWLSLCSPLLPCVWILNVVRRTSRQDGEYPNCVTQTFEIYTQSSFPHGLSVLDGLHRRALKKTKTSHQPCAGEWRLSHLKANSSCFSGTLGLDSCSKSWTIDTRLWPQYVLDCVWYC